MDSQKRQRRQKRLGSRRNDTSKNNKRLKNWAVFSGIGLQMGLTIYLGNLAGKWLDSKFQTLYWENIITILAVFLSMYAIVKRINKLNTDE